MLGSKAPVKLLEVLLPRLGPLRQNADILWDTTQTAEQQSYAAFQMLEDICVCFRTFAAIDLPNVIGSRQKITYDELEDTAWLVSVGMSLDRALGHYGLEWPPPDHDPPSIVEDLEAMYADALERKKTFSVVSSAQLLEALEPVGIHACELRQLWSSKSQSGGGLVVQVGTALALNSAPIVSRLAVVANVAQALTLPAALIAFGTDTTHLTEHLQTVMQVVGRDAIHLSTELIHELNLGMRTPPTKDGPTLERRPPDQTPPFTIGFAF